MKYYSQIKGEAETEELSKEKTLELLSRCYKKEFVDDVMNNVKVFRLQTMTRTIWTNNNGLVPAPGFFGVCE